MYHVTVQVLHLLGWIYVIYRLFFLSSKSSIAFWLLLPENYELEFCSWIWELFYMQNFNQ